MGQDSCCVRSWNCVLIVEGYYIHSCIKMRYKASFSPTSILGRPAANKQNTYIVLTPLPDPESLSWHLLDADFRKNLDTYHYFSPSGHSSQNQKTTPTTITTTTITTTTEDTTSPPQPNPPIDFTTLDFDSDNSDTEDATDIPTGSLFDYHVPGILTKDEVVAQLDLDHWKLRVRNMDIEMEDLKGWESGEVTDPQCLKGIVAELAAALGPEVVKGGSAVDLFGA